MVIGDFLGHSSVGQASAYVQRPQMVARPAVTLEAEPDPKTPHQYSVNTKPHVIPPPERPADAKNASKKSNHNTDPVSLAFLAVADYQPVRHSIDIRV